MSKTNVRNMATRDTIVIGASAGGVKALSRLVAGLPSDLPAAVFIVLHIPANSPSLLPDILSREAELTVGHAVDRETIERGRVYVAPPDRHLLIEQDQVRLVQGPKETRHRPAIDALFRSAAQAASTRVIGVVLTGARDDGRMGMRAIKQHGGIAIVQDPLEAPFPSMPLSVLRAVKVDYSVPVCDMASLLTNLARETVADEGGEPASDQVDTEARIGEWEIRPTN